MPEFFEFFRARDLLHVQVELINLSLDQAASTPMLRRIAAGPAAIVLRLPPQHIAEESALEGAMPPPRLPYRAFLSCPSRLTFKIPDPTREIAFRLNDVLDCLVEMVPASAAGSALPPRLEFPGQLRLAPEGTHRFARQHHPDGGAESWAPVWHMRLDPSAGPARFRAVRNERDRERFEPPARSTLTQGNRADIVAYSERDPRNLIVIEDLLLSSLGATATLKSDWLDTPGLQLRRWSQASVLGRDSYVKVEERGYLFPFGHRASLTTITQREIKGGIAGLVSRRVVVVEELERHYDGSNAAGYEHGGREMPFRSVRIANQGSFPLGSQNRIDVGVTGVDWQGNELTFGTAMFFVALNEANDIRRLTELETLFNANAQIGFNGQRMTLAGDRGQTPPAPGAGETEAAVDQIRFKVRHTQPGGTIQPPFLPAMQTARISLPAIEHYLGTARGALTSPQRGWVTMEYHPKYLQSGFSPQQNAKQVYARFLESLPGLNVPAERSGGLSAPKFPAIDGLSRTTGPVAGVKAVVDDTVITAASLVGSTKLLGTIDLASLISDVRPSLDGVTPAEFAQLFDNLEQLPASRSITQPILTTVPTPSGLETRFIWKPAIRPGIGGAFGHGSGGTMQLLLKGRVRKTATGSAYDVDGMLKSFRLQFLDLLTLDFNHVVFQARAGAKMHMDVSIKGFEFGSGLNFVRSILPLLREAGLGEGGGFQIEPQPDGIKAGFGIGIPSFSLGAVGLENIGVSSTISLPFVPDKPAAVRIALSERSKPFLVSVAPFGGTGFFAIEVNTAKVMRIEGAIEFGGVLAINLLGIVRGGIYAFAGIYIAIEARGAGTSNQIAGFVHWGGYADVLGIISASIEFYVELKYQFATKKLSAAATLTIGVRVLFFSKTFSFTIRQEIANFGALPDGIASLPSPPGAPGFASPEQWEKYCAAFA